MAALSKKVENCSAASTAQAGKSSRPGNPSSNSLKMTPMYPPSPVIEHLTADEIQALKDVFSRMERFEQEETERISKLERDVMTFEEEVEQQTAIKGQMLKQTDIRLCRLCFKNKFADGIGRVCVCCHRRVCNSCGSLSKWQTSKSNPIKHVKARWRCNLCHMRRELAAASGVWFHGGLANPVISSTSFRQKLHDDSAQMEMVNKFGTFAHHRRHPQTILSDSEVNLGSRSALAGTKDQAEDDEDDQKIGNEELQHLHYLQQQQQRRYSSSNLRRLFPSAAVVAAATSAAEENLLLDSIRFEEEEDEQENEEKFLQERAKCRLERLLMQQKKTRKKAPRRASVGTCTMEDMIVTTDEVYDRVTEFLGFTPDDEDSSIGQRSSEERPTPATSHRSSDEPHLPTGSNSPGNALPNCPSGGGGSPATTPSKLNDRRKTESKGRRMSDLSDYVRNGGLCVSRSPPAPPNFPKLSMSRSGSETSSLSSAGGGREAVLKMLEEPDSNRKHDRSTEPTSEQKHSKSFRKLDDGGTSSPQKHHHKIYVLRHIKSSANIKTTGSASPNKDEILEEILLSKRHSASSSSSKRHATDCVERHAVPTSRRQSHPTWLESHSNVFNASSATHSAQSSPARDATSHGGSGGTSGGGAVAQIPTITGDPCSDEEFEEMILRLHKSRKLSDAIYGLDRQRKCSGASHSSAERRKSSNTSLSDWRKMSNSSVLSSGSFASSYRDYQRKFSNSSNISSTASPIRRPSPGSRTAAIANPAPVQPNPDINLTRMQRKFSEPNAGYRRKSSEPDFKIASTSSDRRLSRSSETQRRMSSTVGSNHGHRKLSMSDRVGSIDSGAIISQRLLSKSDVLPKFNKSERTRKLSESAVLALIREKSSSKDDSEHSSSAHETTRRSSSGHHFTVVLQKDQTDSGCRTNGFGMRVVGGKQGPDKKLGAYVTHVIKGGPADLLGIIEGDQVLEWDGRSLQDSTFEEAREIISNSGDTVQLVLMHSRSNIGGISGNATAQPSKHDIPKSRRPSTISEKDLKVKEIKQRLLTALIEQEKSNELAKLEGDDANLLRPIQGRLGLQLKYDSCSMTLAVSVLNCEDLPLRTGLMAERSGPLPKAYVKLNILPRSSGRHSSRTKAAPDTCNPEWNHVFTLEDISAEKLSSFSLLLTVWDDGGLDSDVFLGELLLDLSSVDVQGMTIAYPLQEHDQNCGRMPTPSPKYLLVKSTHKSTDDDEAAAQAFASAANVSSSTRSLPSTPGTHGLVRDFLSRKDRDTSPSSKSTGLAANGHRKSRSSKLKDFKRRVTEMAMKVKTDFQDKWETSSVPDKDEDRQRRGVFWSKRKRKTSLASSLGGSSGGSANTSKNHSQERILLDNPQTIGIENLSSTFLLGPGQIQPKHDQDQIDRGDIKLGLMISKGQLDIDVICARGLQLTTSGQPPDTYVKTSLIEDSGKKRIQKKRTKIVKSSTDPLYVNKLRYSACNAHGRFLQVMVKEHTRSFDPSRCLGEVYIQMDNLDLTSYTTGWFKLFKESSIGFGSSESVVTKTL